MPTSRDGSFSAVAMSASLRLEVLVARIAPGFAAASSCAKRERFASRFSKIASMITSARAAPAPPTSGISRRSEEHTSELQSRLHLVCRLLLEKKKKKKKRQKTQYTTQQREVAGART